MVCPRLDLLLGPFMETCFLQQFAVAPNLIDFNKSQLLDFKTKYTIIKCRMDDSISNTVCPEATQNGIPYFLDKVIN